MRRTRGHNGFTLIEMLLALSLTAALLTIVSITIGSVLRDNQRLVAMRSEPHWLESLVRVVRRDLVQSDSYQIVEDKLILKSHAATAGDQARLEHDSVTIEYRLIEREGARWLLRRVISESPSHTNTVVPAELLCGGIEAFQMTAWENTTQQTDRVYDQPDPVMLPIPDQMMLSITLTSTKDAARIDAAKAQADTQAQTYERLIVIR